MIHYTNLPQSLFFKEGSCGHVTVDLIYRQSPTATPRSSQPAEAAFASFRAAVSTARQVIDGVFEAKSERLTESFGPNAATLSPAMRTPCIPIARGTARFAAHDRCKEVKKCFDSTRTGG